MIPRLKSSGICSSEICLLELKDIQEGQMNETKNESGHGHSTAAWVTVLIVIVAFSIGTLFFWLDNAALVWASAVLAAVAPLVGLLLKNAGYGVGGQHTKSH